VISPYYEVQVPCHTMMFNVAASDKEHDFVRLVTDFVSQLGLQLNVSKLIEVDAQVLDCCSSMLFCCLKLRFLS